MEGDEVFGVVRMLKYNGFRNAIMKGVGNMLFEMSLDRPASLTNVGFATWAGNFVRETMAYVLSLAFINSCFSHLWCLKGVFVFFLAKIL